MKNHKKYLKKFFFVFLGFYLLTGIFNLAIDPYGIYRILVVKGFNDVKLPYDTQGRMVKALQAKKLRPKGIILGSSRTDLGLDPEHPAWKYDSKPVYNLSTAFTSVAEILQLLKYAKSLNKLNQVVIGLDFFSFNIFHPDQIADDVFDEVPVNKHGRFSIESLRKEFQNTIFSFLATKKSFQTLFYKGSPSSFPNGQAIFTDKRSVRDLSNGTFRVYYESLWFPGKSRQFCINNNNGGSRKYEQLKEIINISTGSDIELKIFINPVHADLLEMMSFIDLWPLYEDWKRGLVALTTEIAKQNPEKASVRIWDFSGYNSITTEHLPVEDDPQIQMGGYIEVAHYKKAVGDLILNRIFESSNDQKRLIYDFGYPLDFRNIDTH
jgi:hypothetical protein